MSTRVGKRCETGDAREGEKNTENTKQQGTQKNGDSVGGERGSEVKRERKLGLVGKGTRHCRATMVGEESEAWTGRKRRGRPKRIRDK